MSDMGGLIGFVRGTFGVVTGCFGVLLLWFLVSEDLSSAGARGAALIIGLCLIVSGALLFHASLEVDG